MGLPPLGVWLSGGFIMSKVTTDQRMPAGSAPKASPASRQETEPDKGLSDARFQNPTEVAVETMLAERSAPLHTAESFEKKFASFSVGETTVVVRGGGSR